MTNVAELMKEHLPKLRDGLADIRFPDLRPESEDVWNEGYAIVKGLYYYSLSGIEESEYFDRDQFENDYEKMVEDLFPGCDVVFYWKSQEIEVIRKGE